MKGYRCKLWLKFVLFHIPSCLHSYQAMNYYTEVLRLIALCLLNMPQQYNNSNDIVFNMIEW